MNALKHHSHDLRHKNKAALWRWYVKKHLPRPKNWCPASSPMQTLKHMVRPLLMKFLLMWHLWTMEHLHATKMRLSAALLSAQTPPTPPCSLSNNSMSYLSLYLDFAQRTNHWFRKCAPCWCVAPPTPTPTPAAPLLMRACGLYSAASPKVFFLCCSISAKLNSVPIILL